MYGVTIAYRVHRRDSNAGSFSFSLTRWYSLSGFLFRLWNILVVFVSNLGCKQGIFQVELDNFQQLNYVINVC